MTVLKEQLDMEFVTLTISWASKLDDLLVQMLKNFCMCKQRCSWQCSRCLLFNRSPNSFSNFSHFSSSIKICRFRKLYYSMYRTRFFHGINCLIHVYVEVYGFEDISWQFSLFFNKLQTQKIYAVCGGTLLYPGQCRKITSTSVLAREKIPCNNLIELSLLKVFILYSTYKKNARNTFSVSREAFFSVERFCK